MNDNYLLLHTFPYLCYLILMFLNYLIWTPEYTKCIQKGNNLKVLQLSPTTSYFRWEEIGVFFFVSHTREVINDASDPLQYNTSLGFLGRCEGKMLKCIWTLQCMRLINLSVAVHKQKKNQKSINLRKENKWKVRERKTRRT